MNFGKCSEVMPDTWYAVDVLGRMLPTGHARMRLFLRAAVSAPAWEGFQFAVNRIHPTENEAFPEASEGGWSWRVLAKVSCRTDGERFAVTLTRAGSGIDVQDFSLCFKWNDNMQDDGDIMDVDNNGDTMPGGRLVFCYRGRD